MGLDFSHLFIVGSDHVEEVLDGHSENSSRVCKGQELQSQRSVRIAEPYSTEDFTRVRGGACVLQSPEHCVGDSSKLLQVDFNNPEV